ncbi:MAG: VOC family protein [Oscillospiraceae bacterium]|nr:VOC family protein [Oscillospiraceae bacterium]
MKPNITGLAHIGVFAADMDKSIDFYQRLGFTLDSEETTPDGVRLAFLSAGTCIIELVGKSVDGVYGAGMHIAVIVDSVEQAVAAAKENGIEIDAGAINSLPICGGVKNVFFNGPDGESLEFFEYC